MSIQDSYNDIKGTLEYLYNDYVKDGDNRQENYSNIEHFTVPPLQPTTDERFKTDSNVPEEMRAFVIPSELARVIEKFDLDPNLLNDTEKALRKKYLDLSVNILSTTYDKRKDDFLKSPFFESSTIEQKMMWNTNMDSFKVLTLRIIKLLIKELEPPTKCAACPACPICPAVKCPKCPKCPDNKKKESFKNTSFNSIKPHTLILLFIVLGVLYYYLNKE